MSTVDTAEPVNPFRDNENRDPPMLIDDAKVAAYVDAVSQVEEFCEDVADEVRRMRVRAEARERFDAERHAQTWVPPQSYGPLADELALPDDGPTWRVEGLLGAGENAVLVAGRKAGKTSTVVELVRSLVDGQPFLGRFPVEPFDGTVALFNYEMPERRMREWLREPGIEHPGRVHVLHLRGASLPLSSPHVRKWVVGWLRERNVRVWVLDPYSRAYVGTVDNGNDEAKVGAFLALLDEIKAEAGVTELVMPVHTPKGERDPGQETAIGSQRLEAWPDALWYLTRSGRQRYLRAEGRDVDLADHAVTRDGETRRLALGAVGGRAEAKRGADVTDLVAYVREHPGVSHNVIVGTKRFGGSGTVKAILEAALAEGLLRFEPGSNRARHYYPTDEADVPQRQFFGPADVFGS